MTPTTTKNGLDAVALLAGAAKMIRKAPMCWLATSGGASPGDQRPMGVLLGDSDLDAWRLLFLTDRRSRKASEMRGRSEVAILFQHAPDDAFVRLVGSAALIETPAEVRRRWKAAYDPFFPEDAQAHAIFVQVEVARMELWIRGVTPEPFGMQTTVLERDAAGGWRASLR